MKKKLIALTLTVAMVATMFSCLSITAFAAYDGTVNQTTAASLSSYTVSGYQASTYPSGTPEGYNQLNTNVFPQIARTNTTSDGTESMIYYTDAQSASLAPALGDTDITGDPNNITVSFKETVGTVSTAYGRDDGGFYKRTYDSSNSSYTKEYIDYCARKANFTYYYPSSVTIYDFVIGGHSNSAINTSSYDIYASNSKVNLYNSDNLVYSFNKKDAGSVVQSYHFAEGITAKYFSVVFYGLTSSTLNSDLAVKSAVARISYFRLYGVADDSMQVTEDTPDNNAEALFAGTEHNSLIAAAPSVTFWQKNTSGTFECVATDTKSTANLYDGTSAEYGTSKTVGSQNLQFMDNTVNPVEYYEDGSKFYAQIQYDFKYSAPISSIMFLNHSNAALRTGNYEIFASDSLEDLYSDSNILYSCENYVNQYRRALISFDGSFSARYVAARIYDPYAKNGVSTATDANRAARIGEFNVYGFEDFTVQGGTVSSYANYNTIVDTSKSLIANKSATYIKYIDVDNGKTTPTNYTPSTPERLTTTEPLVGDSPQYGVTYTTNDDNDAGAIATALVDDETRKYQELHYELDGLATISDMTVLTHTTSALVASHVKLSFAANENELFTDDAYTAEVRGNLSTYFTVTLPENITAKYVGVRVICGVNETALNTTWKVSSTYARLAHLDVHGAYVNTVSDNVTVASQYTEATASKSAISGIADANGAYALGGAKVDVSVDKTTFTKDGYEYTFTGWSNGTDVVSTETPYSYTLAATPVTLTAQYDQTLSHTVTFCNKKGEVVDTIQVADSETITSEALAAAQAKLPVIYGYEFKEWNNDATQPIIADASFQAIYEQQADKYTFKLTDSTGTTEYNYAFDTKIKVTTEDADFAAWKDQRGNIISKDKTFYMFVPGIVHLTVVHTGEADATKPLSTAMILIDPVISDNYGFTDKNGNPATGYDAVILSKVNLPAGATFVKAGVIFANSLGTGYAAADFEINPENAAMNSTSAFKIMNQGTTTAASELMIKLSKIKVGQRRAARAYICYSEGGTDKYAYSDVVEFGGND